MNLHYQFWKEYYMEMEETGKLSKTKLKEQNEEIVTLKWTEGRDLIEPQTACSCLIMEVCYPGLVIGLGALHESGKIEKEAVEIKLGITLDPVTGLPYLSGSSLKGILRNAFLSNPEYVLEIVKEVASRTDFELTDVKKLENDMFGKWHPYSSDKALEAQIKEMTAGGRDVFLDAFPVETAHDGTLLALESITPHKAKNPLYQGLTEPNPITLLKIKPGVKMQFRFIFRNSILAYDKMLTANQKLDVVNTLLEDLGVGAKTNVGFGMLKKCIGTPRNNYKYLVVQRINTNTAHTDSFAQRESTGTVPTLTLGGIITVKVVKVEKKSIYVTAPQLNGERIIPLSERRGTKKGECFNVRVGHQGKLITRGVEQK